MPVTLNPTGTGVQDPKRSDMFVRLNLDNDQREFIVYRKFVSNHPLNDFIPDKDKVWEQTSVGMPRALLELARKNPNFQHRLFTEAPDGSTKLLGEDDGLIIHYHGSYSGDRYLDRGRILSQEEADMMMEAGTAVPQFAMWEFRVAEVIVTDGPNLRERLLESAEQKAAHERQSMFGAVRDAFAALIPQELPATVGEAEAIEAQVKEVASKELAERMRAAMSKPSVEAEDAELQEDVELQEDA